MFRDVTTHLDFPKLEKRILEFWEREGIFQKSLDQRADGEGFVFFEGPPTANGKPGVHHVQSRTFKDFVCRYKTMKGFQVLRKGGWDTHGLPVEIEVEKELGLKSKDQVIEYGIDRFNAKCKESVFRYEKEWREVTRRIGFWLDMEHAYITCTNDYIESVWWSLKQFWKDGKIYRGHKILPFCPRCGTPLSSHEVAQAYKDVTEPSVYVKMKLADEENTYFLVWTTTPWTLISNVALAVHPGSEYAKVKVGDEYWILAFSRLEVLDEKYEVVERCKGSALKGVRYEPLFTFSETDKSAFYVATADFVTMGEGTGIVHIAPAFGEDDYNLGKEYDLPIVQPVDERGAFTDEVTPWADRFVKDADAEIMEDLKGRNRLYKIVDYLHSYPHCWRCDTPLLYYARASWFIRTTAFKDRLIARNSEIHWYPREVGSGRFGDWLENNVDWALSRDRFWGTPLNIWICAQCGQEHSVESLKALRQLNPEVPEDLDLHRPFVDAVSFPCASCGGEMRRTPEVIDAWFDSGSMPFAQWHYPFENTEIFDENFPADFISEGIDQTRGWFYSLLTIAAFLFDKPCFKNCVVTELVLDKEGLKMSKSRGNVVDPWQVLETQGADPLRWYLMTVSPPWVPTCFDYEGVAEVTRKLFGTLMNVYSFFVLYANIDGFEPSEVTIAVADRPEIDRWITSRLHSMLKAVNEYLERYDITKAARLIQNFIIDDLSNWYVRRCRRRFWKSELNADKNSAYLTLYDVLVTTVKMLAPFAPFISEDIYQNIVRSISEKVSESIHLCQYPEADVGRIDVSLESRMGAVQSIVVLGRAARNRSGIKVRQPLPKVSVVYTGDGEQPDVGDMESLISEELNVKEIRFLAQKENLYVLKAKPNFKTLGPKFGGDVNTIAQAIKELAPEDVAQVKTAGSVSLPVQDQVIEIRLEDVEITSAEGEGCIIEEDGQFALSLDTLITEELRDEGYAREFVNRTQATRKHAGFNVTDRIHISFQASERLKKAIQAMEQYIKEETLALTIVPEERAGMFRKEWDIDGENVIIGVERTH
ncbi:MAG: isoleucine--tRNA ligase [Gemmatimonadota bacterium]|nr:MAG: isoleucine--tRNA ligase [Gemmatimonadota bacterium]